MENKALLAKSLNLLYRESLLDQKMENSADLVRTVLDNVQPGDISIGVNSSRETIIALKNTILEMCCNPIDHVYERADLLQQLRLDTQFDDRLYESLAQGINEELTEVGLKRSIVNLRKSISNHFKEQELVDVLSKYSSMIKFHREKVRDINQFINELVSQLEPLQQNNTSKDPGIVTELDIGDDSSMRQVFEEMQNINQGNSIYKTGWQGLNNMTQGGLRPGETVFIGALQHKYKTGCTLSVFGQIAQFNHAANFLVDKAKKPLLLRISFEDELFNNLEFLYQYLKYDETRERVQMKGLSIEEMSSYVKEKLQLNGWHVKMLRVDPDQWTYRSICNKIIELEAQGYEVKVLMLDYLYKVSKVGCSNGGITGGEVADLVNKIRNFCSAKKILHITPHQFSTEAKNLLRSGMPEDQFLNEIAEKGYWEGNKGLDRIFDLGILIHLFKYKGEWFLCFRRDKHRISTILDDKYKYFLMKFPKYMPIPSDINGEDQSFRKLSDAFIDQNTGGTDMFF